MADRCTAARSTRRTTAIGKLMRCHCGYQLTYETDICPVCLPNGIGGRQNPKGLRAIANFLGLVDASEDAIINAIDELRIVRDKYEELELQYCKPDESLTDCLIRMDGLSEQMFDAGYENALGVAIQAIEHEKEERTAYHAWDGMKRAVDAVKAVKDGSFVWIELKGHRSDNEKERK